MYQMKIVKKIARKNMNMDAMIVPTMIAPIETVNGRIQTTQELPDVFPEEEDFDEEWYEEEEDDKKERERE